MSDVDTQTETPSPTPDATPDQTSASPLASESDGLDELLAQFERETSGNGDDVAESEADANAVTDDELEKLLAEANKNDLPANFVDPRDVELNAMRAAEHQRQELESFIGFGREIVGRMPATLSEPEKFVERELMARAHDPVLQRAWQLRDSDPAEARALMSKIEIAYRLAQASNDPNKARILGALQQRYDVANIAANAKHMLARLQNEIIDDARKFAKGIIDEQASEDRAMIAQAVRGGNLGTPPPSPPPNLGAMSREELGAYRKSVGLRSSV
ncbi:MAG TPA: hypothetical protein VEI98_06590 [Xanthobacteraceae bacterium]|nr:hypothetical protein [Xanthobacteraceae bacterium]